MTTPKPEPAPERDALRAEVLELKRRLNVITASEIAACVERETLRAEVDRLKKMHSDHCSNPTCEGPRS